MSRRSFGTALLAGVFTLVGCSGESTTAAPPTKICGRTLYSGDVGIFTYNVWTPNNDVPPLPTRLAPIPAGKILPAVLLRVAPTCERGAALTITPAKGLLIVGRVNGGDGRPVAVAVQGGTPGPVTLSVRMGEQTRQLRFSVGAA